MKVETCLMEPENMMGNLKSVCIMGKVPSDGLIKSGMMVILCGGLQHGIGTEIFRDGSNTWVSIEMAKKMVAAL